MKKIIIFLTLTFAFNTHAFDYYGIKSGMSKEEVEVKLKSFGVSQDSYNQVDMITGDVKSLKGIELSPIMISFTYNFEDKLYKLQVNYRGTLSNPNGVALKSALQEKFKITPIESEVKVYSISIETLALMFLDDEIVSSTVSKLKQENLTKLKLNSPTDI